ESPAQILRNMASVGIRLEPYVRKGLLLFEAVRPNYHGLEGHLLSLHGAVERFQPSAVIVDSITGLGGIGSENDIRSMLTRIVGHLKNLNVTGIFTSLTAPGESFGQSEVGVSSLMDAWILIRMVEAANERLRRLYILKSRGMAHSSRVRELLLSRRGLRLADVAEGPAAQAGGRGPGSKP
ncbi:MAG TPA: ATPase domain-containing protein, partial [Acidobacteriota bacterium]|nr:ATPase domain-containing protein [Acidobacteriota bacterium]